MVRLDHLDMLRGAAAFLVCAGHLRAYIFQNFGEIASLQPGFITKAFYYATGFGHQAVIVFFALSGFLVGGKAVSDLTAGRFSWPWYIARRLVRLWVVIVPALFLTFVLDSIGITLTSGVGYDGRFYESFFSGPRDVGANSGNVAVVLTPGVFIGNLAFMQNIYFPIFGSNGPLWSLANEFWYYIFFPMLGWITLGTAARASRSLFTIAALGLLLALPSSLWEGGVIWAAGAAAAWSTTKPEVVALLRRAATRIIGIALLAAALVIARVSWSGIDDLRLGLAVAASLPVLAHLPSPGGLYRLVARGASELSYTLYLTHFPLLTLIVLTGFAPIRLPPGALASAV